VKLIDTPVGVSIAQSLLLAGPLLDEMVVARSVLPFLVRETCINVTRRILSFMVCPRSMN